MMRGVVGVSDGGGDGGGGEGGGDGSGGGKGDGNGQLWCFVTRLQKIPINN